jgi:hypothetical protein
VLGLQKRQHSARAAGASSDLRTAHYYRRTLWRDLAQVCDVFKAPLVLAKPVVVDGKARGAGGIQVECVSLC